LPEPALFKTCSCRDDHGVKLRNRCLLLRRPSGAWNDKHGTWGYQLELPKLAAARRRQLRRTGFTTSADARDHRTHAITLLALATNHDIAIQIGDILHAVRNNQPLPDRDSVARRVRVGLPANSATALGDYLLDWCDRRRQLEPTTLRAYCGIIRNHLVPHLGHVPIGELRVHHVQGMFDAIIERNAALDIARQSTDPDRRATTRCRRNTGPATMHRIRAVLRKALNDAIRTQQLIEFNPAAHVELPSGKRPKARVWTAAAVKHWQATGERPSRVMVWTPAQAGAFLDYAEAHDIVLYPMFALILHRGLRRGEAVGLSDADTDLDTGSIVIRQQITTVGYTPITKRVKSDAGDRTVILDSATLAIQKAYRARRATWQLASGPKWPDTGLFYVQPDGNPWHPEAVSNRFERLIAAAGLPPIRLHDLRHCAATFLKASGADMKDIQELLGHSSIAISGDTYTSVVHELETERAKAEAATSLVPRARIHESKAS
jgi:integrase